MLEIEEYLESKGCEIKGAGNENIHTHCFFCGEDTSKLGRLYINVDPLSEKEGLSFCFLCNTRTNLNGIRRHFGDPPLAESDSAGESEYDPILDAATEFYHLALMDNPEAYEYLTTERGFTDQTIVSARLGWAEGGSELHSHLMSSFPPDKILESGLANKFSRDFFQQVITIPYLDYGRTINLRGKQIGGKYLGLPGRAVSLYGSDSTIGEDTVLLSEGEFCSLHLQQLGYASVGVPGAQTWKSEWDEILEDSKRNYIIFDADKAGKAGAEKLAAHLGPKSRIITLPKKGIDIEDYIVKLGKHREDVDYLLSKAKGGILISVKEAYDRWAEIEGNPNNNGLRFNIQGLDLNMNHGLLPGQVMTLIARTGVGKPHPHSTIISTPKGDVRFGDLKVGDQVFGSHGGPINVLAVHEQGVIDTYRVSFSDGTSVLAGPDHLWEVISKGGRSNEWIKKKVLTTTQILDGGLRDGPRRRSYRYRIPLVSPVVFDEKDLRIPPYTMGALISNGDTTASTPLVTTPDPEVFGRMVEEGVDASPLAAYSEKECPQSRVRGSAKHMRYYGLDVRSGLKFIPYDYLTGSVEQRTSLLRGLMDGDGGNPSSYAGDDGHHKKHLGYWTTSERLASDVVRLINSLGGTATVSSSERVSDSGTAYLDIRLSIMLPDDIREGLFTSRKEHIVTPKHVHVPHRAIVSIEKEGRDNQRCITVDSEDSLYAITENYILTHNSAFAVSLCHRIKMANPDFTTLILSLELTRNEWFDRMHKVHAFYEPTAQPIDTVNFWNDSMMLVDKNMLRQDDLLDSIYQFTYEMSIEPRLVIIDYLGYFARGGVGVSEYDRVTNAMMNTKAVAKDIRISVLALHQANRSGEIGKELAVDNAKSSSAVEETSDLMLGMWSPDTQKDLDPADHTGQVYQKILKNRNGPAGQIVKYQWAPLTTAMVPLTDFDYINRATNERKYAAAGDNWRQAVDRHRGGSLVL